MTNQGAERGSLLQEVAYGVRHGVFDDRLGQSLLRAWQVGACDAQLERMIRNRVRVLRVQDAFGVLDPFTKPRLRDGEVVLGLSREGHEVRIPIQWLTTGLLVAGNTGSGKTTLLTFLIPQILATACQVWVTDMYKRTLRHLRSIAHRLGIELLVLRAGDWRVNLLQPWTGDPRDDLATIVDLLVRVLGLPPRSRTIVLQGGHCLYEQFGVWEGRHDAFPTLYDLYEWVWARSDLNQPAREAILDRLGAFLTALTPSCGAYRVGWNPIDLARYSIVHELAGAPPHVAHILLESALSALMRHEVVHAAPNARIRLFLALDDGQRYLDGEPLSGDIQPLDELAGVIRGQGLGLGVFVQTTSGVSDRLMANLAVKVFGRLGLHTDWSRLAAELGLDQQQLEWSRRQTRPGVFVGQVAEQWREPFIFCVPRIDLPSVVTDAEAAQSTRALNHLRTVRADEYMQWKPAHLRVAAVSSGRSDARVPVAASSREHRGEPAPEVRSVTKEELDYLANVAAAPLECCSERDRRLGIGASKGHRLRTALVQRRLVRPVAINPGGRGKRFQLLNLTDEGRALLEAFGVPLPRGHGRGGLTHQWWCQTVSEWLRGHGAQVVIEDDSHGARVDIVATAEDGQTLAIEVETSPGHELENIQKDLGAGFHTIVSLVDDPAALRSLLDQTSGMAQGVTLHVGSLRHYSRILEKALQSLASSFATR